MAGPQPGVAGNCTFKYVQGTGWVKQSQSTGNSDCTSAPNCTAPDGTVVVIKCSTGAVVAINPIN